jgi:hypothetical protein
MSTLENTLDESFDCDTTRTFTLVSKDGTRFLIEDANWLKCSGFFSVILEDAEATEVQSNLNAHDLEFMVRYITHHKGEGKPYTGKLLWTSPNRFCHEKWEADFLYSLETTAQVDALVMETIRFGFNSLMTLFAAFFAAILKVKTAEQRIDIVSGKMPFKEAVATIPYLPWIERKVE